MERSLAAPSSPRPREPLSPSPFGTPDPLLRRLRDRSKAASAGSPGVRPRLLLLGLPRREIRGAGIRPHSAWTELRATSAPCRTSTPVGPSPGALSGEGRLAGLSAAWTDVRGHGDRGMEGHGVWLVRGRGDVHGLGKPGFRCRSTGPARRGLPRARISRRRVPAGFADDTPAHASPSATVRTPTRISHRLRCRLAANLVDTA